RCLHLPGLRASHPSPWLAEGGGTQEGVGHEGCASKTAQGSPLSVPVVRSRGVAAEEREWALAPRGGPPTGRGAHGNGGVGVAARGPGQLRGVIREVAASQALALRVGGVRA